MAPYSGPQSLILHFQIITHILEMNELSSKVKNHAITLLARRLGPDLKTIRVRVMIRIYRVATYFIVIHSRLQQAY